VNGISVFHNVGDVCDVISFFITASASVVSLRSQLDFAVKYTVEPVKSTGSPSASVIVTGTVTSVFCIRQKSHVVQQAILIILKNKTF